MTASEDLSAPSSSADIPQAGKDERHDTARAGASQSHEGFAEDARYRAPESVVAEELDGETVLLNMASGVYYGLDAVGTRMWRAFATGSPCSTVSAGIAAEYPEAARDQIEQDTLRLLHELLAQGLLTPDSA